MTERRQRRKQRSLFTAIHYRCGTCGALPGAYCVLWDGTPRPEFHATRVMTVWLQEPKCDV